MVRLESQTEVQPCELATESTPTSGSTTGRRFPTTESARDGWAHHGVAVTAAGNVIASHPGTSELLEFNPNGDLLRSSPTGLTECHGICTGQRGRHRVPVDC